MAGEGVDATAFTYTTTPTGTGEYVCVFTHPVVSAGVTCHYSDRLLLLRECVREVMERLPSSLQSFTGV
jgi:hypothetical protein